MSAQSLPRSFVCQELYGDLLVPSFLGKQLSPMLGMMMGRIYG
jgi:hypothetical protein